MASTRMFPTVEAVSEQNLSNGFTTDGSWINSAPVSTPPQQRALLSANMSLSSANSIKPVSPYTESQFASLEPKAKIENDSTLKHPMATPQQLLAAEKNTASFTHSPAVVSSIFPNELPARPASRPSFINRVFHLSLQTAHTSRSDKHGHNVFGTPDIDMGQCGAFDYGSRKDDKYRSIKLDLLLAGGTVLCLMLGMVVYLVVMYARDEHVHARVSSH